MAGRLKTAFLSGTITNNPLAIGGTTLTSAALASLPVVASPDIAVIVLDPAGSAGAPEVVWVTAHAGADTSATIERGKEGTAAREHLSGVAWTHGPTIMDFTGRQGTAIASAATLTLPNTDEDFFEITGSTEITAISARAAGKIIHLYVADNTSSPLVNIPGSRTSESNGGSQTGQTAGVRLKSDVVQSYISLGAGNWTPMFTNIFYNTVETNTNVTIVAANTYYTGETMTLENGLWIIMGEMSLKSTTLADTLTVCIEGTLSEHITAVAQQMVADRYISISVACPLMVTNNAQVVNIRGKHLTGTNGTIGSCSLSAVRISA